MLKSWDMPQMHCSKFDLLTIVSFKRFPKMSSSHNVTVRTIFLSLLGQLMKNIFHQSFNAYKTDIEPRLNDVTLNHMQCSRRLFEIQLSHRRVSAAYIEGDNVAVTVEGEAARVLNFDTGTIKIVWDIILLEEMNLTF